MRHGWRAWILFGTGALFGLLAGAVLYAPPELGNQPPPWQHWAWEHGGAAAATRTLGAAPAQPIAASLPQPASATPEPATATAPALALVPALQVATSVQPPAKVANVNRAPAVKEQKPQSDEPIVETAAKGAGPALLSTRVEPEPYRAPAEYAPPRGDGDDNYSPR